MTYSVRKGSLTGDRDDIFSLWEEAGSNVFPKRFSWIYENNPAGMADVWLVRHDESNECVGMIALFPCYLRVNGKRIYAAVAGDLFLLPQHRTAGPALMLMRSVTSGIGEKYGIVYTFPNRKSEAVVRRVGFKLLGKKARYMKPITARPLFGNSRAAKAIYPYVQAIANPIVSAVNVFQLGRRDRSVRYSVSAEPDASWESLVNARDIPFAVQATSQLSELVWKHVDTPTSNGSFFSVYDGDGKIVGGIIYHESADELIVKRIYSAAGSPLDNVDVWQQFFFFAKCQGVDKVRCSLLENTSTQHSFKNAGFVERDEDLAVYVLVPKDSNLPDISEKDSWLLFQSDDDM